MTTAKRSAALPDVPTLDEAGLKGFDLGTWFGVLAPAGTPKTSVTRLNTEMVKIIQSADFRKKMEDIGADPSATRPTNGPPDQGRYRALCAPGERGQGGAGVTQLR